jgi:hypothetical protein
MVPTGGHIGDSPAAPVIGKDRSLLRVRGVLLDDQLETPKNLGEIDGI